MFRLFSVLFIQIALVSSTSLSFQYLPTNQPISTESADQGSPAIAVDPNNQNHLIASWDDSRGTDFAVPGYSFSTDGGNSWTAGAELVPGGGFSYGFNTSCGIDKSGNEYIIYTTSNGFGLPKAVYIAKSTNNGSSWSSYQVSSSTTLQDKPFMTIDNTNGSFSGRLYATWVDFNSGSNILASYSTNQGQTWLTAPCQIEHVGGTNSSAAYFDAAIYGNTLPSPNSVPFITGAVPTVDASGNIHVAYLYINSNGSNYTTGEIRYSKSTNGGASFSTPQPIASMDNVLFKQFFGGLEVFSSPTIATDPVTGNIFVAYAQSDGGDDNIYYVRSTDGGSSWSTSYQPHPIHK